MESDLKTGFVQFAVAAIVLASATAAAQSTFRITQVFSSFDGTFQFIELTESAGLNGQHHIAGLTLTSHHGSVSKQFTLQHDLPTASTANMSVIVSVTDNLWILDRRPTYPQLQPYFPEFVRLPRRFVSVEAGTLDFAGIDRISYAALPTDGNRALYRDGKVRSASLPANGRCFSYPCEPRYLTS
jgi:serralysin